MSENDRLAYGHYVALCISAGFPPLSFTGWQAMAQGEIPEELINLIT
jgi:hypothetical protein